MAEIFGQTFVDATGNTNKRWTVAVSFIGQIIAVGVSILVPLVFAGVLPKAQLIGLLTAPPQTPPPPSPPTPVQKVIVKQLPRQFDVGVDVRAFRPVRLAEILGRPG